MRRTFVQTSGKGTTLFLSQIVTRSKHAYTGPDSESMFSFQNLTRPSLLAVAKTFPSGDKDKSFTLCIRVVAISSQNPHT